MNLSIPVWNKVIKELCAGNISFKKTMTTKKPTPQGYGRGTLEKRQHLIVVGLF